MSPQQVHLQIRCLTSQCHPRSLATLHTAVETGAVEVATGVTGTVEGGAAGSAALAVVGEMGKMEGSVEAPLDGL